MKRIFNPILISIIFISLFISCGDKNTGFVIMPRSQEILLGEQLDSTIKANPEDYPILPDTGIYSSAYDYLEGMMNSILTNSYQSFNDKWEWKVTIINEDVMNAFAAPGGKLYFYTGLMKYLDNGANLAGVLAHEMAHVELRHSAKQMQAAYGMNFAASILFGTEKSQLETIVGDIAAGLAALQFSRGDEYQADEFSVKYLSGTSYHPKGIAGFFEQLNADGKTNESWEVLSSHPSDDNRLANIEEVWEGLGSPDGDYFEADYNNFKTMLP
ncbi:MAG: M48 family metalloprotease [Bacteroidales bacterium]|nr:M48 family metalloprotease [Bacteroidales bacterium]MBN2819510.1 M48 family metalloprotease [Bacteroidales bacterium]